MAPYRPYFAVSNLTRFAQYIALSTFLASCCAATRSYTSSLSEHVAIRTANVQPSNSAHIASTSNDAINFGIKAVLRGAKALINGEAKKFSAAWSSSQEAQLAITSPLFGDYNQLDKGLHWAVIRTVDVANIDHLDKRIVGLQTVSEMLRTAVTHTRTRNQDNKRTFDTTALQAAADALKSPQRVVTFAAVGTLSPEEKDSSLMRIRLTGYTYPAFKAKRLCIYDPIWGYHRIQSVLSVSLRGPMSDTHYDGKRYETAGSFKIAPTPVNRINNTWQHAWRDASQASPPLTVPRHANIELSAGVIESSKLRTKLLELGKIIGDLDIDLDSLGLGDKKDGGL